MVALRFSNHNWEVPGGWNFLFLFLLTSTLPVKTVAGDTLLTATLVGAEKKVSAIQFTTSILEVRELSDNGAKIFQVELEGKVLPSGEDAEGWSLVIGGRIIRLSKGGLFKGKVPLTGKTTSVTFIVIGPRGEVTREDAGIVFKNFGRMGVASDLGTQVGVSKLRKTAGIGMSALTYTESARGKLSQTALVAKFSADNPVSTSRWSLGGNFFSTLSTVQKSTSSSVQVLGINFRAGYLVPCLKPPWMFRVYAGIYYTTTYGGTADFGYSNLAGPQIFPTLSYRFQDDAILSGYLKFSPVSSGFKVYGFENSETAIGLSYFFPPFKSSFLTGASAGITADFSLLKLQTDLLGTVTFMNDSLGTAVRF